MIVEAGSTWPLFNSMVSGERDDVAFYRLRTQPCRHFVAVHPGHADVQQNDVRI